MVEVPQRPFRSRVAFSAALTYTCSSAIVITTSVLAAKPDFGAFLLLAHIDFDVRKTLHQRGGTAEGGAIVFRQLKFST